MSKHFSQKLTLSRASGLETNESPLQISCVANGCENEQVG